MSKAREILEELRLVLASRGGVIDAVLPPVVFLILNVWSGFESAVCGALILAVVLSLLRLARRQSWMYAFGGVLGVLFAILVSRWLDRSEGYFLPNILVGAFTVLLCLFSVIAGRPLVAWTSYLARRWPRDWYWHPRVRPAYSEVTLAWAMFFALRLMIQLGFFQQGATDELVWINLITGWPATLLLLITSYLYGSWRLAQLSGPSVQEFKQGASPPWQGQRRGF
jgi:hypothetical protein